MFFYYFAVVLVSGCTGDSETSSDNTVSEDNKVSEDINSTDKETDTYAKATYVCEDCGKSKPSSEMYSTAGDVDGKTECMECQAEDDRKALEGFNS